MSRVPCSITGNSDYFFYLAWLLENRIKEIDRNTEAGRKEFELANYMHNEIKDLFEKGAKLEAED